MTESHDIRRLGRIALTALCIGTGAVALSALPLGGVAQAKNNDHGGDHGGGHADHGGNGGGNGNGNGNGNGQGANHGAGQQHGSDDNGASSSNAGTNAGVDTDTSTDTSDDDASLSAHGLGKLNGFFHASPQALANASPHSSIGRISQTFEAALSSYAEADQQQQQPGEDGSAPPTPPTATGPTVGDLGAILAGATNKPVTAAQVQAIAARLAELHPEDTALADFAANPDEATCQEIADAANAAKGNTGDATTDDTTTVTTTSTSE